MPLHLLDQLVDQYHCKNHRDPRKIVVAPLASVSVAYRKGLHPEWQGIPVEIRLFEESEVVANGTCLGVFLHEENGTLALRGCELA